MGQVKFGVGIIGLSADGGWAATAHLPALRALPECEVRGLVASSAASAQKSAHAHGVAWCSDDPLALAQRADIDLVVVAVKVPEHRKVIETLASAGKTVYCEWPLGVSLDDARRITQVADRHGVRGFVGLQARASSTVRYVRDLVRSGEIGEVVSTSLLAADASAAGRVAPRYVYSLDSSQGVSTLSVTFGHAVDALCWCLGDFDSLAAVLATRAPTASNTQTGEVHVRSVPDQVAVAGRLASGAVASLHYRGIRSAMTPFLWEINGTKGDLVVTAPTGHMQYGDLTLRRSFARGGALTEVTDIPDEGVLALPADGPARAVAQAYRQVFNELSGVAAHAPSFADALRRHELLDRIEQDAASR
ncbi:MAG: Gfo/Idh/MocA family oxidoreductase [Burkholderiaceae bacterium]|nr:Gfo/Idh/MocA family oxidoreductase [Burkholderiaceae bacterium]